MQASGDDVSDPNKNTYVYLWLILIIIFSEINHVDTLDKLNDLKNQIELLKIEKGIGK